MKKYNLSDETKTKLLNNPLSRLVFGNLLYREVATTIPTLSSEGINDEKESNLSDNAQEKESNLSDNDRMFKKTEVFGKVFGNAKVDDEISDKTHFLRHLSDGDWLFEQSKVFGNAKVYRDDLVDDNDNALSDGLNDLSSQDDIQL